MKKWPIVLSSHIVSLSLSLSLSLFSRFLPCVPSSDLGVFFSICALAEGQPLVPQKTSLIRQGEALFFGVERFEELCLVFFLGGGGTIGLVRASHLCTSLLLHFTLLPLLTLGVLSKVVRMQVDESWDTKSMGQQQHVENTCGSLLRELQVCLSIRVSELLCAHLGTFFSDQGSTWNALELCKAQWAYAKHMVFCGFCKCSKYGTRSGRMIQRETRCCCSWSRSVWRSTGERWSVPAMPVHSCIKILLIPKLNWQHFSLPLEILQFHELVSRTCLLHPQLHTYAIMSIPGKTHRIKKPQSFG